MQELSSLFALLDWGMVQDSDKKTLPPVFTRLLRKSKVRPDPWTPDVSRGDKAFLSPQASADTSAPVAVKW